MDALVLDHLSAARQQHPHLANTIDLQHALWEAGNRLQCPVPDPPMALDLAKERLRAGEPLLHEGDFNVDCGKLLAFEEEVRSLIGTHRPDLKPALAEVETDLASQCGTEGWIAAVLASAAIDPDSSAELQLTAFVLRQTLYPFLRAYASALMPQLEGLVPPRRGRCPVCDAAPDMAALKEPDGERYLLCNLCDTEWRFVRVGCPSCGNEDSSKLSYYLGEDEAYRLYVCEACRCYLKTVDQRQRAASAPLPVERIVTVNMDAAALEAGYRR